MALKSIAKVDESGTSSEEEENCDEDIALLTRNFKKFLKFKKFNKGKFRKDGKKEDDRPWNHKKAQITCFECKK